MTEIDFDVDTEFLIKKVNYQVDRLKRHQINEKRKTASITLYRGFASAATTAFIGLGQFFPSHTTMFQVIALIISAALTIVTAWDSLFQHKELWILFFRGRRRFHELQEDIEHAKNTESLTPDLLKIFYKRYKSILEEFDLAWEDLRSERNRR